jgi:hypothetical protein
VPNPAMEPTAQTGEIVAFALQLIAKR